MATHELVIKGGTIIDGLRTPRYKADIGIADGRITHIGKVDASEGAEVVDASGRIVAPGFVDLHTHYDSQVFWDPWCTMSELARRDQRRDWQLRLRVRPMPAGRPRPSDAHRLPQ